MEEVNKSQILNMIDILTEKFHELEDRFFSGKVGARLDAGQGIEINANKIGVIDEIIDLLKTEDTSSVDKVGTLYFRDKYGQLYKIVDEKTVVIEPNIDSRIIKLYTKVMDNDTKNVYQVTFPDNCSSLFGNITGEKNVKLEYFEIAYNIPMDNITDMSYMFVNATKLNNINIKLFETINVEKMNNMFENCTSLETLNLSSFNTDLTINMNSMFKNCSSLETLNIEKFNAENSSKIDMFINCYKLNIINILNHEPILDILKLNIPYDTWEYIPNERIITTVTPSDAIEVSQTKNTNEYIDGNGQTYSFISQNNSGIMVLLENHSSNNIVIYPKALAIETQKLYEIVIPTNCENMFSNNDNLETFLYYTNIENISKLHSKNSVIAYTVRDMSYMFENCPNLNKVDMTMFDYSDIQTMINMFKNCKKLTTIIFPTNFKTDKVADMSYMFSGCNMLDALNLTNFSTAAVTDMRYMFNGCNELLSIDFPSSFTTANVSHMENMFSECAKITALNISTFNMYNVQDSSNMFENCSKLSTLTFPNTKLIDISNNNTYSMFSGCSSLRTLDFTNKVNTSSVNNMENMFSECSSLTTLILSNDFTTSSISSMKNMFSGCINLKTLDLTSFSTALVTDTSYMFSECNKLETIEFSNDFITSLVTDMRNMFNNCNALKTLNLTSFTTSNVQYMQNMFNGCSSLVELDLNSFTTVSVNNMENMLSNCYSLSTLYIQNWFFNTNVNINDFILNDNDLTYIYTNEDCYPILNNILNPVSGIGIRWYYETDEYYFMKKYPSNSITIEQDKIDKNKYIDENGLSYTIDTINQDMIINRYNGNTIKTIQIFPFAVDINTYRFYNIRFPKDCSNLFSSAAPDVTLKTFVIFDPIVKNEDEMFVNMQHLNYMFSNRTGLTKLVFPSYFKTSLVTNMQNMFSGCSGLETIEFSDNFDTSSVNNMKNMFSGCSGLNPLNGLDLTNFSTVSVNNMSYMFNDCKVLETIEFSDNFSTKLVTYMQYMFNNCFKLQNITFPSTFSTANVTDMQYMFNNCGTLTILDLTSFSTEKLETIISMFGGCSGLESIKFSDNFTTELVTNMQNMFFECGSLKQLNLSNFNTQKVWTMEYMFGSCGSLTELNLSLFTTTKLSVTKYMFRNCVKLQNITFSDNFSTDSVTDMSYMFANCTMLNNLNITYFNTDAVKHMNDMFYDCKSLTSLNLSNFNTNSVKTMNNMFYNCNQLNVLEIGNNFIINAGINTGTMFDGCVNLREVKTPSNNLNVTNVLIGGTNKTWVYAYDINTIITKDITNIPKINKTQTNSIYITIDDVNNNQTYELKNKHMEILPNYNSKIILLNPLIYDNIEKILYNAKFPNSCEELFVESNSNNNILTQVIINTGFDTSNITTMKNMFKNCVSLTSIAFPSDFNTSNVTTMQYMFNNCNVLNGLDLTSFSTELLTDTSYMFNDCKVLGTITFSDKFTTKLVTDMKYMFNNCNALNSLDLTNFSTAAAKDMKYMFNNCNMLNSLDLSSFSTELLTNTSYMFSGCSSLGTITFSNKFETKLVSNMKYMFSECSKLNPLDLSSFSTAAVTDMQNMFSGCGLLESLNISNFTITSNTYVQDILSRCIKLINVSIKVENQILLTELNKLLTQLPNKFWPYKNEGYTLSDKPEGTENDPGLIVDGFLVDSYDQKYKPSNDHVDGIYTAVIQHNVDSPTIKLYTYLYFSEYNRLYKIVFPENCDKLFGTDNIINEQPKLVDFQIVDEIDMSNVTSMNNMFGNCLNLISLNLTNFVVSGTSNSIFLNNINLVSVKFDTLNKDGIKQELLDSLPNSPVSGDWTEIYSSWTRRTLKLTNETTDSNRLTYTIDSNKIATINSNNILPTVTIYPYLIDSSDIIYKVKFAESYENGLFSNNTDLIAFNITYSMNTDNITSTKSMFNNCTSLINLDLTNFNPINITSMENMFSGCSSLKTINCLNLVVNDNVILTGIFNNCNALTEIEINDFENFIEVLKSTFKDYIYSYKTPFIRRHDGSMIKEIIEKPDDPGVYEEVIDPEVDSDPENPKQTYKPKPDLTKDIMIIQRNVKSKIIEIPSQVIVKATNIIYDVQFPDDCSRLFGFNNVDINSSGIAEQSTNLTSFAFSDQIDTTNITNMDYMFGKCTNLINLNLDNFKLIKLARLEGFVANCNMLNSIAFLINFNTSLVTSMSGVFSNCNTLKTLDLSNFDTSAVTDMRNMFSNCAALNDLEIDNFSSTVLQNTSYMFSNCGSLKTIVFPSNFTTESVTDMRNMFSNCASLTDLQISSFNSTVLENTSYMFSNCNMLRNITFSSNFTTELVTDMERMFSNCISLETLDLSEFHFLNVDNLSNMFDSCYLLGTLDLSMFEVKSNLNINNIFNGDSTLNSVKCLKSNVKLLTALKAISFNTLEWDYTNEFYTRINRQPAFSIDANLIDRILIDDNGQTYTPTYTNNVNYAVIQRNIDSHTIKLHRFVYCIDENISYITIFPDVCDKWFGTDNIANEQPNLVEFDMIGEIIMRNVTNMNYIFGNCKNLISLNLEFFPINQTNSLNMFINDTNLIAVKTNINLNKNIIKSKLKSELPESSETGYWTDIHNSLTRRTLELTNENTDINGLTYTIDENKIATINSNNTLQTVTIYPYLIDSRDIIYKVKFAERYENGLFSNNTSLIAFNITYSMNTDNVTNTKNMFSGCTALTDFNLSKFNTINVNTMENMFSGCNNLSDLNLSELSVVKVNTMENMFSGCNSLETLNLLNFKINTNITTTNMFFNCSNLTTIEIIDYKPLIQVLESQLNTYSWAQTDTNIISRFEKVEHKVVPIEGKPGFYEDSPRTGQTYELKDMLINGINEKVMVIQRNIKSTNISLHAKVLDIKNYIVYNVRFPENCNELFGILIPDLPVDPTENLFSELTNFKMEDIPMDNVTSMNYMFGKCNKITNDGENIINLTNFKTGTVTSMKGMFAKCTALKTLILPANPNTFNTISVQDMSYMFIDCNSLNSIDFLNSFTTTIATDMSYMFYGCSVLNNITINASFETINVKFMNNMFMNCVGLTNLNLNEFNTSAVINMNNMFNNCNKLATLDLTKFTTTSLTNSSNMFTLCNSLTSIKVNNYKPIIDIVRTNLHDKSWAYDPSTSNIYNYGYHAQLVYKSSKQFIYIDQAEGRTQEYYLDLSKMFVESNTSDVNIVIYNKVITDDTSIIYDVYFPNNSNYLFGMITNDFTNLKTFKIEGKIVDPSNVTNVKGMFRGCNKLVSTADMQLDLSNLELNVSNISYMFENCTALETLNLSPITCIYPDPEPAIPVTYYVSGAFSGCSNLSNLDITNVKIISTTINVDNLFTNCTELSSVKCDHETTEMKVALKNGTSFDWSYDENTKYYTKITRHDGSIDGTFINGVLTDDNGLTYDHDDINFIATIQRNTESTTIKLYTYVYAKDINRSYTVRFPNVCDKWFGTDNIVNEQPKLVDFRIVYPIPMDNITSMNNMFGNCLNLISLNLTNFVIKNGTNLFKGNDNMVQVIYDIDNKTNLETAVTDSLPSTELDGIWEEFETSNNIHSLARRTLSINQNDTDKYGVSYDIRNNTAEIAHNKTSSEIILYSYVIRDNILYTVIYPHKNIPAVNFEEGLCHNNKYLISFDIKYKIDMDGVMGLSGTFESCSKLQRANLFYFNTSSVTDMKNMFYGCSVLTELDLTNFTINSNTITSSMFSNCNSLTTIKIIDYKPLVKILESQLSGYSWAYDQNTNIISRVEKVNNKVIPSPDKPGFYEDSPSTGQTYELKEKVMIIQRNITSPKIRLYSRVFNTDDNIFYDVRFPGDCEELFGVRGNSPSITSKLVDFQIVEKIDMSNVTNINSIFENCVDLISLNLTNFVIPSTNNNSIFLNNTNLVSVQFDATNETDIKRELEESLPNSSENGTWKKLYSSWTRRTLSIPVSPGNTDSNGLKYILDNTNNIAELTRMHNNRDINDVYIYPYLINNNNIIYKVMFPNDSSELFGFNGSAGENYFKTFKMENISMTNVNDISYIFAFCTKMNNFDLSNFNTINVTNMSGVFEFNYEVQELDLSSFDTSKVTNMRSMFSACTNLTTLDLSNFTINSNTNTDDMFYICNVLETIKIINYKPLIQILETQFPNYWWGYDKNITSLTRNNKSDTIKVSLAENTIDLYIDNDTGQRYRLEINENIMYIQQNLTSPKIRLYSKVITTNDYIIYNVRFPIVCDKWFGTDNIANEQPKLVDFQIVSKIDMTNITSMNYIFGNCLNLISLNLTNFVIKNGTNLFKGNDNMIQVIYDTANKTNLETALKLSLPNSSETGDWTAIYSSWTRRTLGLTNGNIDSNELTYTIDSNKIATINSNSTIPKVFIYPNLIDSNNSIYKVKFANSYVNGLFSNNTSLNTFNIAYSINTDNMTSTKYMFNNCTSLINLDLSKFNTNSVNTMEDMFSGCSKLATLNLLNFEINNNITTTNMFSNCSNLTTIVNNNYKQLIQILELQLNTFSWIITNTNIISRVEKVNTRVIPIEGETGFYKEESNNNQKYKLDMTNKTMIIQQNITNANISLYAKVLDIENYIIYNVRFPNECDKLFGTDSGNTPLTDFIMEDIPMNNVTNMSYMFGRCNKVKNINTTNFDTSNVTDMSHMFYNCSAIQVLDVSKFDISNVEDTSYMFYNCSVLENVKFNNTIIMKPLINVKYMFHFSYTITTLDLSNFDLSKVNDLSNMFAGCARLKTLTLPSTTFSNSVTSIEYIFDRCNVLTDINLSSLGNNTTTFNMTDAFRQCYALVNLDISNINASNIILTNNLDIFTDCSNLESIKVNSITSYSANILAALKRDLPDVIWVYDPNDSQYIIRSTYPTGVKIVYKTSEPNIYIDHDCLQKYEIINDINGTLTMKVLQNTRGGPNVIIYSQVVTDDTIKTYNITFPDDCSRLYENNKNLTSFKIDGNLTTANVNNIYGMFSGCNKLSDNDFNLSSFVTSNVRNMSLMFQGCTGLTELNISSWNTSNVNDMSLMFQGCTGLTTLNINTWDTSNVNGITSMFQGCSGLTELNISSWNTSNVNDMRDMFQGCSGLVTLDLSNIVGSLVNSVKNMFYNCTSLVTLDLSNFSPNNVDVDVENMIRNCIKLKLLNISNFNLAGISNISGTFLETPELVYVRTNETSSERLLRELSSGSTDINGTRKQWTYTGEACVNEVMPVNLVTNETTLYEDINGQRYALLNNKMVIQPNKTSSKISIYPRAIEPISGNIYEIIFNENSSSLFKDNTVLKEFIVMYNFTASNVKDVSQMFENCISLEILELNKLHVVSPGRLDRMFYGCSKITNIDLSSFTTNSATIFSNMVDNCSNLRTINIRNFSGITSEGNKISFVNDHLLTKVVHFYNNVKLLNILILDTNNDTWKYDIDLESFIAEPTWIEGRRINELSKVFVDINDQPYILTNDLDRTITISKHRTVDKPTDILLYPYLLDVDTSIIYTVAFPDNSDYLFGQGSPPEPALETFNIKHSIPMSNVINMNAMFVTCKLVTTIDLSKFDTRNVVLMERMFSQCIKLTNLILGDFDMSKVTNNIAMFSECTSLISVKINVKNVKIEEALKTDTGNSGWYYDDVNKEYKIFTLPESYIEIFPDENTADLFNDGNGQTYTLSSANIILVNGNSSSKTIHIYAKGVDITNKKIYDIRFRNSVGGLFNGNNNLTDFSIKDGVDYSNVNDMNHMFYVCRSLTELDLSTWNTSNVNNMSGMFAGCIALNKIIFSNTFSTAVGCNMNGMFRSCSGLTTLNINTWDTSNVNNMSYMFSGCSGLTEVNISNWNTSNVNDMTGMFAGCIALNKIIFSNTFSTAVGCNMNGMFYSCTALKELNISTWDTSNVNNMSSMFSECVALETLDLNTWNTSNVNNMSSMFQSCTALANLDLSTWDTSNVNSMNNMFSNCHALETLDLNTWNTSNVNDMRDMFRNCEALKELNINTWNTSNVNDMRGTFRNCITLNKITFSNTFSTAVDCNMGLMFSNCRALKDLNISTWNTSNVNDMSDMFYLCRNLVTLSLGSNFVINTNTSIDLMFNNTPLLTTVNIPIENPRLKTALEESTTGKTWNYVAGAYIRPV